MNCGYYHSSHTNAATISQSSALEPGDLCLRRKCKRKTTAAVASAIKMALVAIIARDAEVIMIENSEMSFQKREGERKMSLKKRTKRLNGVSGQGYWSVLSPLPLS